MSLRIGWTMACGTGRVTADLVIDKKPETDVSGRAVSPYG